MLKQAQRLENAGSDEENSSPRHPITVYIFPLLVCTTMLPPMGDWSKPIQAWQKCTAIISR